MDHHERGSPAASVRLSAPVHKTDGEMWMLRGPRQRYADGLTLAIEYVLLLHVLEDHVPSRHKNTHTHTNA